MNIRNLRRWWQIKTGRLDTPIDGEVPFWIVSLGFHVVVILVLAGIIMPSEDPKTVNLIVEEPVDIEDTVIAPDIEFDDLVNDDIGADGDDGFEAAASQAPTISIDSEDAVDLNLEVRETGELVTDNDFFEATGETLSTLPVKGSVGNSVKAASGAVDRITQEILSSIEERETVVVWLFDQSASLQLQRDEILARFDRIYEELGVLTGAGHSSVESDREHPLQTQIYAFGKNIYPLLAEPTDNLTTIKTAVSSIERDNSGIENVMEAIITAAKDHAGLRRIVGRTKEPKKNVMLIVVSDEAGDDVGKVDEAVRTCARYQMPVYVIGVPAPFGRAETRVKWIDPDPQFDQTPQWALVSQGPETVLPERLKLDFSGAQNDVGSIDSGFGPFHLTRLCFESGGIYFAVHPNRVTNRRVRQRETKSYSAFLQYFFEPDVMRRYKPDYVSNKTYMARLKASMSRQALVNAAAFTSTGALEAPRLRFPKLDEARFVNMVTRAQQAAAFVEPRLNQLYEILRTGEKDREDELSPRWQAGYDLAMGRAIAAKVRAESYNAMLALVKTQKKFDPPTGDRPQNNTWVLVPADSVETGSQDTKLLEKARQYLTGVVEDHPDTPWALLAQRELATPIGWQWKQSYTPPPQPRQPRNAGQPRRRPQQPRPNVQPKTKRPPPKL